MTTQTELLGTTALTTSGKLATDLANLIRSRVAIIIIETTEESRVERYLIEAAAGARCIPRTWDCGQGVRDMAGNRVPGFEDDATFRDIGETIKAITERAFPDPGAREFTPERGLWILRDAHLWIQGPPGVLTLRSLCNFARSRGKMPGDRAQAIVILSPSAQIPAELKGHATVVQWALPDRAEIKAALDVAIENNKANITTPLSNGDYDAVIDAAIGLTESGAVSCFSKSIVERRGILPSVIAAEKKRIIAASKTLTIYDPLPGGFDSVGGLENVKAYIRLRKSAYSANARAYGLATPRGIVFVGPPGNGKTFLCQAIAAELDATLVRWDPNAGNSKFLGESETAHRDSIKTIDAMGKVVVFLDEIEKTMQGATSGSADGGVSADKLGTLLTWLNDRTSEAFVIATSNDATALPPELFRKGRFDELFFVDLPTLEERKGILAVTLKKHRKGATVNLTTVARATPGFSGAEIAALVPDAMFNAFSDGGRDITTDDLLKVRESVTPLSVQREKEITALRTWAKGRTRPASPPEVATTQEAGGLDL